ncbi:PEP-utilizing enzyme [Anabaenopsis sp. FSS-46]|uniref:putative PEP-binding protein n=1 Tax=Anabaenopsis sp. FSS-46 TaxID=2971766 RepID=UPI002473D9DB|nr:putative PEP-binding protein [Anabaenopsis sp. FSS-46]MDH6098225.1 PEP-utilizing enzyme [Anabaenopsis sp. FSS-46]
MDKLYWLDQIQLQDRRQVGDKAFYLSKIMQRGYPVIPGFVVSAEVLREFLATLNSKSALVADLPYSSLHLDVANWRQLQVLAGRLRREILTGTVPPQWVNQIYQQSREWDTSYVILRPSVALSGMMPEMGNPSGLLDAVFCGCDEEKIASALKRTWSQLFRARSLLYWRRMGVNLQKINLAVLVQPVENAIASGLLYAHSTTTPLKVSEWTIEATKGLGIAICQGDVLPDVYYVQLETGLVLERHLGHKIVAYGFPHELWLRHASYQPSGFDDTSTLDSSQLVLTADHSHIVTYILSQQEQKQFALSEEHLQQVMTLGHQLVSEIGNNFSIKWTISADTAKPNLYLTQVSYPTKSTVPTVPWLTPRDRYQIGMATPRKLIKPTATQSLSQRILTSLKANQPTPAMITGIPASGGRVKATAVVITDADNKPRHIDKGVILVVPTITPDWLPLLQNISGLITEKGGLTSHGAILARELRIPAVVNAVDATVLIKHGEGLLVDGDQGEIYPHGYATQGIRGDKTPAQESQELNPATIPPSPQFQIPELFHKLQTLEHIQKSPGSPLPPSVPDCPMISTQLLLNLSQPILIQSAQSLPVDGVGLLRSELMLLNILEGEHPQSWLVSGREAELLEKWTEQIIRFAAAFAPRPVFYRSLDWPYTTGNPPHLESPSNSDSVALAIGAPPNTTGHRGTFGYLCHPAVFELELTALATVQKAGYTNINLLLPFVRSVAEFSFCREKVEKAGLTQVPQFQLWIMAEVPSVLFLLPEYVKAGVAGISIGTNDLTQLLLGVDREQGDMNRVLNELHPAVMGAIAQLIQMAQSAGIPCSICGQAPAIYPEIIDQLIQWGITSISVEPEAVDRTYRAIARAEQRLILAAARNQLQD